MVIKLDVRTSLSRVGEARRTFTAEHNEFRSTIHDIMRRLIHEAAAQRMSPNEVARLSGFDTKRVRSMMREFGLNPRDGKTLLSKKASEALTSNAELMGIDPSAMDLLSPLAYLPMGKKLKEELSRADEPWDESGEEMRAALMDDIKRFTPSAAHDTLVDGLLEAGWHK